ncbi:hypothetical protein TNCT_387681 [Trichonephila clavata]|uniref:Uncharacterized protein n=1 Tax=Trichonephila clavata TaxID=2740835 RepID=A0A8X6IU83_TRICU|nr:hypothetical protein TNCT_387681 [Trichonephila clavata]
MFQIKNKKHFPRLQQANLVRSQPFTYANGLPLCSNLALGDHHYPLWETEKVTIISSTRGNVQECGTGLSADAPQTRSRYLDKSFQSARAI